MGKMQQETTQSTDEVVFNYETADWMPASKTVLNCFAVDNSILAITVEMDDGESITAVVSRVRVGNKQRSGVRRLFEGNFGYDYHIRAVDRIMSNGQDMTGVAAIGLCGVSQRIILLDDQGRRVGGKKSRHTTSIQLFRALLVCADAAA